MTTQILKGIGKKNGDGWKDVTRVGEVVFVWNTELPRPYKPGQYPRIGSSGWSASTEQYDFQPATADEAREAVEAALERRVPATQGSGVQTVDVDGLVNRFLGWPVPVAAAANLFPCIERPIGTHLMLAEEAKAMFEYCLGASPVPVSPVALGDMPAESAEG